MGKFGDSYVFHDPTEVRRLKEAMRIGGFFTLPNGEVQSSVGEGCVGYLIEADLHSLLAISDEVPAEEKSRLAQIAEKFR